MSRHGAQILGVPAVVAFSVTLPATRAAAPEFGGVLVGLGRAAAAVPAGLWLLATRASLPPRRMWWSIAIIALGVVVGFPTPSRRARGLPLARRRSQAVPPRVEAITL